MKFDYKNIDFLVLLPCPMKAAFGIIANQISIEYAARTGSRVNFLPVSGMDVEVIHDLMSIDDAEDFPAVMMIPGMGIPYSKRFMEKFRRVDCFESIMDEANPTFREYGFYDPEHVYDIVGISPIAFFADKSYHPDMDVPRSWEMLLNDPQYTRMVGMPGRENSGFQDFPIMAAYHLFGEDGVLQLARTARSCLLPAEMVRMAGSRHDLAPAVGILNYSMAKAAGQKNSKCEFIWPEEGLFAGPITMLTRKSAPLKSRELAKEIVGMRTAGAFRIGGFYSAADKEPLGSGKIMWHGWDFIENNDINALSARLCKLVFDSCNLVRVSEALKKEYSR